MHVIKDKQKGSSNSRLPSFCCLACCSFTIAENKKTSTPPLAYSRGQKEEIQYKTLNLNHRKEHYIAICCSPGRLNCTSLIGTQEIVEHHIICQKINYQEA
ncbi:hypothetical protein BRADI_3g45211v3 [Brachypodium distachyon]|uniref:Uncharacterized protein n=1 Tax=Brachypodium distachyon TaxID=15368 RepID=A0A0Q3FJG4_BRADI|nr:hypothetical protein BRADI_3g45211v3 [Brachypodium distachyon]